MGAGTGTVVCRTRFGGNFVNCTDYAPPADISLLIQVGWLIQFKDCQSKFVGWLIQFKDCQSKFPAHPPFNFLGFAFAVRVMALGVSRRSL